MERPQIVNDLIARRNYQTYLEIGVEYPENFFDKIAVLDDNKLGVDPAPKGLRKNILLTTSDDYFERHNGGKKFDVVYVDGLHTFEQTDKDIANALSVLNEGGVVVIDDAFPKDDGKVKGKWLARPLSEYKWPEAWMGGAWKAVWKHFHESGFECATVDIEHGQAIIDTSRKRDGRKVKIKKFDASADFDYFEANVKNIIRPISVEEYEDWIDEVSEEETEPETNETPVVDACD